MSIKNQATYRVDTIPSSRIATIDICNKMVNYGSSNMNPWQAFCTRGWFESGWDSGDRYPPVDRRAWHKIWLAGGI